MTTNEELAQKTLQVPVKTILIVEDDPSIGEMFVQTLAEEHIYNPCPCDERCTSSGDRQRHNA